MSHNCIYLIGDAAAQVKVTTVGGLVTGLRGAKAAANAILGRSDYSKELKSLQRELSLHLLIRDVLNRFGSADYDRLPVCSTRGRCICWVVMIATTRANALPDFSGPAAVVQLRDLSLANNLAPIK